MGFGAAMKLDDATKILLMKISTVLAIAVPVFFAIAVSTAAFLDNTWSIGSKSLSRLGISENRLTAALFNGGCIIAGILGTIAGSLIAVTMKGLDALTGVCYAASLFFLIFIGAVTLENYDGHSFVSTMFGLVMIVTLIIGIISDFKHKRHPEISIIIGLAGLIVFSTQEFDIWEVTLVTLVIIWTMLQGMKIIHYGNLRAVPAPIPA